MSQRVYTDLNRACPVNGCSFISRSSKPIGALNKHLTVEAKKPDGQWLANHPAIDTPKYQELMNSRSYTPNSETEKERKERRAKSKAAHKARMRRWADDAIRVAFAQLK
jgi:hypothetical protein